MARNDPQVNIRLPVELKTALEAEAEKSARSFKAEIVARLEQSFEIDDIGRDVAAVAMKLTRANKELQAENDGLALQLDMLLREQVRTDSDLERIEEIRAMRAEITKSEEAAIAHLVAKYRDGFEFMARFYEASVSDRVGRDQMGRLLREAGFRKEPNT